MTAKKRNILIAAAVLIVLAAAALILSALNRPDAPDPGRVSVSRGETEKVYTMAEIAALPYVEVEKEIVSSSFENDEGVFRGVPLRALLGDAGIDLSDAAQVIIRSEDGFVSVCPAEEVRESDSAILVYMKNGEGLGGQDDGGSGPFRVLMTDDEFGNRSAKYVCALEVR